MFYLSLWILKCLFFILFIYPTVYYTTENHFREDWLNKVITNRNLILYLKQGFKNTITTATCNLWWRNKKWTMSLFASTRRNVHTAMRDEFVLVEKKRKHLTLKHLLAVIFVIFIKRRRWSFNSTTIK